MLPGHRALAFVSSWFDPQTVASVFAPLIADWQREWLDAPATQRAWVAVRGGAAKTVAIVACTPRIVRTRMSRQTVDGVATWMFRFTVVCAAALAIPVVRAGDPWWFKSARILISLPTMVALALPFSVVGAVDVIRRRSADAYVQRAAALKVALTAAAIMLLVSGWMVPMANQAWRFAFDGSTDPAPIRNSRELVLTELIADPSRATTNAPGTWAADRASQVSRELNERLAFVALPLVLVWRRWRAMDLPTGRWFSSRHPIVATLIMLAAYVAARFVGRLSMAAWELPPGFGAWTTVLLFVLLGIARGRVASLWRTP